MAEECRILFGIRQTIVPSQFSNLCSITHLDYCGCNKDPWDPWLGRVGYEIILDQFVFDIENALSYQRHRKLSRNYVLK